MTDIDETLLIKNAVDSSRAAIVKALGDHAGDQELLACVVELLCWHLVTCTASGIEMALHNLAVFHTQVKELIIASDPPQKH